MTAELEHTKGEIAERKRLRARHAVLAAVATAKAAQQDAEIKQAEEQLWLLEEQAAKGGITAGDTQECQVGVGRSRCSCLQPPDDMCLIEA